MRVTVALAVLAVSLSVGGCARPYQEVYIKPIPSPPRHATKVNWVKRSPPPPRNLPELAKTRSVKPPPLPAEKSAQTRSPIPPSSSSQHISTYCQAIYGQGRATTLRSSAIRMATPHWSPQIRH